MNDDRTPLEIFFNDDEATRIADLEKNAARYRRAIETVCEGWTLPHDARKVLETALWPKDA